MSRRGIIGRSLGWLAGSAAALLIVLAVLVGVARLLLPLAPDYQDQIRRFAIDATGFDIRFASLSASWPLRGPEVRFSDVHIATLKDHRHVLDAGELSVGVNLWRLIVDRKLQPGQVSVSDAELEADHLASGQWLINAVPLDELLHRPRGLPLPRIAVQLQNIALVVHDAARLEPQVRLRVEQLDLEVAPDLIGFDAALDGRDGLGEGLEVTGTLPAALLQASPGAGPDATGDPLAWNVRLNGANLDVARLLRVVTNERVPLVSGRGTVDVRAALLGLVPQSLAVDLELGPSIWDAVTTIDNNYRRLKLQADWSLTADGWQANLERFKVERGAESAAAASGSVRYRRAGVKDAALSVVASDVRLQDLWPVVWSIASSGLRRDLLPERLVGDVRELRLDATLPADQPPTWTAEASFRSLGLVMPAPGWAVTGITGSLRGDQAGGQFALESNGGLVRFPKLFRADIRTSAATGKVAWKRSPRGFEVFSDDLHIATPDGDSRSQVRLIFPVVGSMFVDIASRLTATSAPAALNYLPLMKFKPGVVQWLDRAVVAGSVPKAELLWQGPLRGFPYEAGDGRFRVEFTLADAVLDYSPGWPRLENTTGTVIIDRVTLTSVENRGSVGGVPFDDAEIRVANLIRDAELDVAATDEVQLGQILGFLRQTPVAALLGPALETATGSGDVTAAIELQIPIASPKDYRLDGTFVLDGARLGLKGVDLQVADLDGTVHLDTDRLRADNLAARFLDEPISISVRPARADEPELTQVVEARGATPSGKLAAAFSLPYAERLGGRMDWTATVQVPVRRANQPLRVQVESGLENLVSTLAPPLTKDAGVPEPLKMEISLPERDVLQVSGRLERGVSWALQFVPGHKPVRGAAVQATAGRGKSVWQLERGLLRSGRPAATLPADPGLEIDGNLASLRFEDWLPGRAASAAGSAGAAESPAGELIRRIDFGAGSFAILGWLLRDTRIDAVRDGQQWEVTVQGPSAVGTVTVPVGATGDAPVVLDMSRLWLLEGDPAAAAATADPRNVPAIKATVADFAFKDLHLGRLTAELAQRGDGVVVEPLEFESPTFRIKGDATWVVEDSTVARQRSELRLRLQSTNIASTMQALGYNPVVEGEKAAVSLDLFWPGGPSEDFPKIAGGRVVVNLDKGQFLPVDPGGGRFVGLLSIATLPRRLGLDFSDVTDKGLAFDQVKGEFRLDGGNAFTCNFGLEGPVADVGIVGRVSLRDRSYDQLAVVRPHVSDALAVGGFVGGPLVGGTVLLISQIFRKPLSLLGESYYRVSGSWDRPVIDKVQKSAVDVTPFQDCERYLSEALKELPPEAELGR